MIKIAEPSDWKDAMRTRLKAEGRSHYSFVRECAERSICTQNTAECLLAAPDTVTGQREPSFRVALQMAALAGYEIVLMPKRGKR